MDHKLVGAEVEVRATTNTATLCPALALHLVDAGWSKAYGGLGGYSVGYLIFTFLVAWLGSDLYEFLYHRLGHSKANPYLLEARVAFQLGDSTRTRIGLPARVTWASKTPVFITSRVASMICSGSAIAWPFSLVTRSPSRNPIFPSASSGLNRASTSPSGIISPRIPPPVWRPRLVRIAWKVEVSICCDGPPTCEELDDAAADAVGVESAVEGLDDSLAAGAMAGSHPSNPAEPTTESRPTELRNRRRNIVGIMACNAFDHHAVRRMDSGSVGAPPSC